MSANGMAVLKASPKTLGRTSSTRSPSIRRRWSRMDDKFNADCLTSSIGRSSLIAVTPAPAQIAGSVFLHEMSIAGRPRDDMRACQPKCTLQLHRPKGKPRLRRQDRLILTALSRLLFARPLALLCGAARDRARLRISKRYATMTDEGPRSVWTARASSAAGCCRRNLLHG
jgi:hypothetical protein